MTPEQKSVVDAIVKFALAAYTRGYKDAEQKVPFTEGLAQTEKLIAKGREQFGIS